jgi:hypothetical protein
MTIPRSAELQPDAGLIAGMTRKCFLGVGPDRRGEAFDIFTTIFLRPALELGTPIRRAAGAVIGAGTHLRTRRRRRGTTAAGR